ncbi:MAG: biotin transporter BioY, partial [Bacteroidales bacterium]|nr:biotin transporter BioY [Bacteroidales bacterium]
MKKLFVIPLMFAGVIASAQTIDNQTLKEVQSSYVKDDATIAIHNFVSANTGIKNASLNADLEGKIDHFFKYRCDVKGITDQKSSGRCWMFTSMNQLRPLAMKMLDVNNFDFSHNYNYFWDLFEKSNLFLENIIATANKDICDRTVETLFKSPVDDGGVWNLFYNLGPKYGVVPQSVMPETAHSNSTGQLTGILKELLRKGGYDIRESAAKGAKADALRKQKVEVLKEVYRVLALCLGEPPTEFTWKYKNNKGEV